MKQLLHLQVSAAEFNEYEACHASKICRGPSTHRKGKGNGLRSPSEPCRRAFSTAGRFAKDRQLLSTVPSIPKHFNNNVVSMTQGFAQGQGAEGVQNVDQ